MNKAHLDLTKKFAPYFSFLVVLWLDKYDKRKPNEYSSSTSC